MAFPITKLVSDHCVTEDASGQAKPGQVKDQTCLACSLWSFDFLMTITGLVVGILGLTAVLNLPVAASGTFIAVALAIPVLYAASYFFGSSK